MQLPEKIKQFTPKPPQTERTLLIEPFYPAIACEELRQQQNQLIDYLEAKENTWNGTVVSKAMNDAIEKNLSAKENFHSETGEPMFTANDFITMGNNMLVFNTPELLKAAREALLKIKK